LIQVKAYLQYNFNRHFNTNRAPFMISLHATFFTIVPNSFAALKEFLAELSDTKPEVYQVSTKQMLDWMRTPKTLAEIAQGQLPSWQCEG
jgi:hypothetical protein